MSKQLMAAPWSGKYLNGNEISTYTGVRDEPVLVYKDNGEVELRIMDGFTVGGVEADNLVVDVNGIPTNPIPKFMLTPKIELPINNSYSAATPVFYIETPRYIGVEINDTVTILSSTWKVSYDGGLESTVALNTNALSNSFTLTNSLEVRVSIRYEINGIMAQTPYSNKVKVLNLNDALQITLNSVTTFVGGQPKEYIESGDYVLMKADASITLPSNTPANALTDIKVFYTTTIYDRATNSNVGAVYADAPLNTLTNLHTVNLNTQRTEISYYLEYKLYGVTYTTNTNLHNKIVPIYERWFTSVDIRNNNFTVIPNKKVVSGIESQLVLVNPTGMTEMWLHKERLILVSPESPVQLFKSNGYYRLISKVNGYCRYMLKFNFLINGVAYAPANLYDAGVLHSPYNSAYPNTLVDNVIYNGVNDSLIAAVSTVLVNQEIYLYTLTPLVNTITHINITPPANVTMPPLTAGASSTGETLVKFTPTVRGRYKAVAVISYYQNGTQSTARSIVYNIDVV